MQNDRHPDLKAHFTINQKLRTSSFIFTLTSFYKTTIPKRHASANNEHTNHEQQQQQLQKQQWNQSQSEHQQKPKSMHQLPEQLQEQCQQEEQQEHNVCTTRMGLQGTRESCVHHRPWCTNQIPQNQVNYHQSHHQGDEEHRGDQVGPQTWRGIWF